MAEEGDIALLQAGTDIKNTESLQRGARNFMSYCSGCHSLKYLRYNRLAADLNIPESELAANLMFTSDKVDARRAETIGLVNRVVPDVKLGEEAFALAKSVAEGPTIALRYMKDNLDEALLFDFATARDHEAERLVRTTMTADHKEAVQAFIDKRKAVFAGK